MQKRKPSKKQLNNLKPVRTSEEAKTRGKQGGIKSGISRNKDKNYKRIIKILSTTQIRDKDIIKELEASGLDTDYRTYAFYKLFKLAFYNNNMQALNKIIDTLILIDNETSDEELEEKRQYERELIEAIKGSAKELWKDHERL